MPMRRRVGITGLSALLLLTPALAPRAQAQTVKTSAGAVEVPSTHGRTWLLVPNQLWTIRMDANGQIIASAAPISVAHEEATPMCAPVMVVSANPSNGDPGKVVSFPPSGRCSFDATAATLVLPVDSAAKYARICNQPWRTVPSPSVCTVDNLGKINCVYVGPQQPLPIIGDAWRRAEGWTGMVPYNGVVQVALAYTNAAPDRIKNVINPGVQVTCDAVPCVAFAKTLPDAFTGRPYRAQLFTGAHSPVTITNSSPPAGLTVGADGYLSGTPTTPGWADVSIGFDESYACPWNWHTMSSKGGNSHWTHTYRLGVRDGTPPAIASFTTSADTVPANGDDVVTTVKLTDDVGVAKVLSSRMKADGTGNAATMTMTSGTAAAGTWTITWPMPANPDATPVAWTIKVWASDAAGNVVNATPRTVVVGGKSSQERPRLPIKKP